MKTAESAFKMSYDSESDTLSLTSKRATGESVEVAEDIIIDLDKKGVFCGLEIMYAREFFEAAGTAISAQALEDVSTVTVRTREYRNQLFITILIPVGKKVVEEKLPPLALERFESPLVANV